MNSLAVCQSIAERNQYDSSPLFVWLTMWKRGELIVVIAAGKQGVLDNHAIHLALDFRNRLHSNCGAIVVALI